jgi:conjugative relaxase-like TrwC/TraI family protein
MLRIIQSTNAAHAKSYYSMADYYLANEQELAGQWRGEGARRLGLHGEVKQADWDALCDNRHPETGERLTARQRADRTTGYDFNFHVPKSVSLLYAATRDERLLTAFRDSVEATMQDIEAEMQTRVRQSGRNENRHTGNLVYGEFIHFTSRPVGGEPDPHLHAHCYVFNTTFDKEEDRWKAGQFRELKRDAPYFEAVFHSRLAHQLGDLGLPVERTTNGWEIAGVKRPLIDKFSRRKEQIEEKARQLGLENADAKAELGARTRENKQKNLSFEELQESWRGRMTADEQRQLDVLKRRLGRSSQPLDSTAAARGLEYAVEKHFERKSVVPERTLLATALRHSVGKSRVEDVQDAFQRSDLIRGARNDQRLVTTRSVLAEEKKIITFARDGRGTCRPFAKEVDHFSRDWLNDSQKKAVRHIVESRDRVIVLRGAAGVGKTTLMQEAVEQMEARGTKVHAFAPSADASRGVLRAEGFKDADTVALLLKDERKQRAVQGGVIWIDEAGLLGSKTLADVFALADKLDSRVLLTGDRYQHGSVERGAALRLLEQEAGLMPAEVKEIKRQSGAYKEAVKALADGQVADGFRRLDDLQWIHEVPLDERYQQLASEYVHTVAEQKTALVISPTHAEGHRINDEIRRQLKESGRLGTEERQFLAFENANLTEAERGDASSILEGDVLVFHQNAKGFERGQRVSVSDPKNVPVDQAARYQVFHPTTISLADGDSLRITRNGLSADGKHRLNNGAIYQVRGFDEAGDILLDNGWTVAQDYGHFTHGYVVTSHSSQGKTVDRVFVGQSSESFPASSREQFYVTASRAREQVSIYTDNKQDLLDAVKRGDERLSATELVNGLHDRVPLRTHLDDRPWEPDHQPNQDREGLIHER